jgi:alpha-methylacyl-CoA racemase
VAIVGAPGARAEEPGHDLTYLADNGLISGPDAAAHAVRRHGRLAHGQRSGAASAMLMQRDRYAGTGDVHPKGVFIEVALADAAGLPGLAAHLGPDAAHRLPWVVRMRATSVYPCKDGRVAVAALEPHFAASLCKAAGIAASDMRAMFAAETHAGLSTFFATQTRKQLDRLAIAQDIPLHTLSL